MLAKCFYLVVLLTAAISMTFTNVTFYPEGKSISLGKVSLKIRNLSPTSLQWSNTNISSSTDDLIVSFDKPVTATMGVQVYSLFVWLPATLELSLAGSTVFQKNATDVCDAQSLIRDFCNMEAHVVIRVIASKVKIADVTVPVCSLVEPIVEDTLRIPAEQSYPALVPGATDIQKVRFFKNFAFGSKLAGIVHLPYSQRFVAENAVRVSVGSLVPSLVYLNTTNSITSTAIDTIRTVTDAVQNLLHISATNHTVNSTISFGFNGGNITMTSVEAIVQQIMTKEAQSIFKMYVPNGASLAFDVVVNGLKCNALHLICSVPATNGIEVINSHFTGFGDLNGILDRYLGAAIDQALTKVTFTAVKTASLHIKDRYYLPNI